MDIAEAWIEKNFEVIWTEDGSPSLRPLAGHEMMHHRGGALAETQMIYGQVVQECLGEDQPHILSVGLGLGYNELVTASRALALGKQDIRMRSFEADPVLRDEFVGWVCGKNRGAGRSAIYQWIVEHLDEGSQVLSFLSELYQSKKWTVEEALDSSVNFPLPANCILFDAYSTKTSPELWSEEFMKAFLEKASAGKCVFSTYACTGTLRRSLIASGFTVEKRMGFKGKRNSTLAKKGY